jgi:hypothetical protein
VVVTPRRYWRPGTAIAAGAAIGFVAGAAAVSLAGTPPQSGQCWYYTSPDKTTGFWDGLASRHHGHYHRLRQSRLDRQRDTRHRSDPPPTKSN